MNLLTDYRLRIRGYYSSADQVPKNADLIAQDKPNCKFLHIGGKCIKIRAK